MLARLIDYGRLRGEAQARRRTRLLAEAAVATLPSGVSVAAEEGGVILAGRRLRSRHSEDSRLRWIMEAMR